MKQAKFGVALVATAALVLSASPAMASVDTYSISTATKKKPKKKAAPVYYATMNDGTRAQCTIVGTAGSNKIQGTPGNDVICGLGGNDKIYGNGGNDFIDGGTGNDLLVGGDGDDLVSGAAGTDKVDGSNGDDVVNGGSGNDTLTGSTGIDEVVGEDGNDKVVGGSGDDLLQGGAGKDTLTGEDGNDELDGGPGKDVVAGGAGLNTCVQDTTDRGPTGCYFDNSDPVVTDFWTDPAVVDTSTGPQTFNVYLRLHDDTGGFGIYSVWSNSNVGLNFSKLTTDSLGHSTFSNTSLVNGNVTIASCSKVDRIAQTQTWMVKPIGCRVGGDRMDPLLRVTYTLPQYSSPGTYQLTSLHLSDAASNQVNYQYRQCGTCTNYVGSNTRWIQDAPALSRANLLQAGPGDVTPPTITSITYSTTVNTASQDQIIEATIIAADDYGFNTTSQWGTGASLNFLNAQYAIPNSGPTPRNVDLNGMAASILCSNQQQNFGGMPMGCQESPGVFKVKIKVPQSAPDGSYKLMNANIVDAAGNSRNYSTCLGCTQLPLTNPNGQPLNWISEVPSSGLLNKLGYVPINAGAAPQIRGISVETPNVNSGGSEVFATVVVTVHDDDGLGAGSNLSLNFSRSATDVYGPFSGFASFSTSGVNQTPHLVTCAEIANQPNYQAGCLRSSGGGDYVFQIPVRVSAHAGKGTYYFATLMMSDGINTSQVYSAASNPQMRPAGAATIENIQGSRPTFENSY